jgi:uncharacterized Zn finger protein
MSEPVRCPNCHETRYVVKTDHALHDYKCHECGPFNHKVVIATGTNSNEWRYYFN